MPDRTFSRRYVWMMFLAGFFVGGWIQRLADTRRYDQKVKELAEEKRTHVSCKVTLPNGAEAAYAIRTDSAEDVMTLIRTTVAALDSDAEIKESGGCEDPLSDPQPVTLNLTVNHSSDQPIETTVREAVYQAIQFTDIGSGRRLDVNTDGNGMTVVTNDQPVAAATSPSDFIAPTSAEARQYLEHDRWTGA